MTDDRQAGLALLVGSLGGVVTMAIHPTVGTDQAGLGHLAMLSGVAHSLALGSVLLLFLGACGLAWRLRGPDRLAIVALVTFGFAAVAVMVAGTISGFVLPGSMRLMTRDAPEAAAMWRIAMAVMFQLNQACSGVYSVGTAGAIVLWSVCCLQRGRWSRGVAVYGCVTAPLIALLIAVGHLRLNVHGMTVVMVSEVIWFIGMGVNLWRNGREFSSTG